jgi:transcriptional regulator with XRE-family HTH domain
MADIDLLTPRSVRAARALLAWRQGDLARAASVATSTIADFERGQRTPVANNATAIKAALEAEGIEFLPGGDRFVPDACACCSETWFADALDRGARLGAMGRNPRRTG